MRFTMTSSQSGAPFRKRCRVHSKWEILFQRLYSLYRTVGLQIILSEGRSCLGRIQLRWKTRRDPLLYQEVRRSCPVLVLNADESRIEMNPYTRGIETLNENRPWLSLGDIEIYLQGWFAAQAVLCRNVNSEHQTTEQRT